MQSCARGDSCGVVHPRAKANGEDDEMIGRVQPRLLSRVYSSILCVYWTDMLICWEAFDEQQLGSESHGPGNA